MMTTCDDGTCFNGGGGVTTCDDGTCFKGGGEVMTSCDDGGASQLWLKKRCTYSSVVAVGEDN